MNTRSYRRLPKTPESAQKVILKRDFLGKAPKRVKGFDGLQGKLLISNIHRLGHPEALRKFRRAF